MLIGTRDTVKKLSRSYHAQKRTEVGQKESSWNTQGNTRECGKSSTLLYSMELENIVANTAYIQAGECVYTKGHHIMYFVDKVRDNYV